MCQRCIQNLLIFRLEYRNEAGNDQPDNPKAEKDKDEDDKNVFTISTYSTHHLKMEGITFYTEEFRIESSDAKVSYRYFRSEHNRVLINSLCSQVVFIIFSAPIRNQPREH